jgi:hypothetical protein
MHLKPARGMYGSAPTIAVDTVLNAVWQMLGGTEPGIEKVVLPNKNTRLNLRPTGTRRLPTEVTDSICLLGTLQSHRTPQEPGSDIDECDAGYATAPTDSSAVAMMSWAKCWVSDRAPECLGKL